MIHAGESSHGHRELQDWACVVPSGAHGAASSRCAQSHRVARVVNAICRGVHDTPCVLSDRARQGGCRRHALSGFDGSCRYRSRASCRVLLGRPERANSRSGGADRGGAGVAATHGPVPTGEAGTKDEQRDLPERGRAPRISRRTGSVVAGRGRANSARWWRVNGNRLMVLCSSYLFRQHRTEVLASQEPIQRAVVREQPEASAGQQILKVHEFIREVIEGQDILDCCHSVVIAPGAGLLLPCFHQAADEALPLSATDSPRLPWVVRHTCPGGSVDSPSPQFGVTASSGEADEVAA